MHSGPFPDIRNAYQQGFIRRIYIYEHCSSIYSCVYVLPSIYQQPLIATSVPFLSLPLLSLPPAPANTTTSSWVTPPGFLLTLSRPLFFLLSCLLSFVALSCFQKQRRRRRERPRRARSCPRSLGCARPSLQSPPATSNHRHPSDYHHHHHPDGANSPRVPGTPLVARSRRRRRGGRRTFPETNCLRFGRGRVCAVPAPECPQSSSPASVSASPAPFWEHASRGGRNM